MTIPSIGFSSAAFPPYGQTHPVQAVLGVCVGVIFGAVILLLALVLLFTLYRLLVRKPSVIVNEDGIVDGCSLIAGGMGLIRWDEIEAIVVYTYKKQARYVCVITHDERVLDNPLVRLFRRSISLTLPKGANLPEWLLSISVDELAEEIQRHYDQIMRDHRIATL